MKRVLLPVLVLVALFAVACGSSGAPESYEDQQVEFTGVSGETEEVGLIEKNTREACELANDEISTFSTDEELSDYCKCVYDNYENNLDFEVFKAFNDEIGDRRDEITGPDELQAVYRAALDSVDPEEVDVASQPADITELITIPCEPYVPEADTVAEASDPTG